MPENSTSSAIQQDLGRRCALAPQENNPLNPLCAKTLLLESVDLKRPRHAIKYPCHIQLAQQGRHLLSTQRLRGLLNKDKVILNASSSNEGALIAIN
jgi:hypothetical protein